MGFFIDSVLVDSIAFIFLYAFSSKAKSVGTLNYFLERQFHQPRLLAGFFVYADCLSLSRFYKSIDEAHQLSFIFRWQLLDMLKASL